MRNLRNIGSIHKLASCCVKAFYFNVMNVKSKKMEQSSSSSEEETLILYALYRRRKRKSKRQRRFWTRPIYSQRKQRGCYSTLVQEMRLGDPQLFFRYFRMSKETFDVLLSKVSRTYIQQRPRVIFVDFKSGHSLFGGTTVVLYALRYHLQKG